VSYTPIVQLNITADIIAAVASQPINEGGQSPGAPEMLPRVFVNIFFWWHTAQKILTYWFCNTFKGIASQSVI